jgi:hypothetical protein
MKPEETSMKPETVRTLTQPETAGTPAPSRRAYTRPWLEVLGDIRDLTLGGTPGTGDSGDPVNFDPPQP